VTKNSRLVSFGTRDPTRDGWIIYKTEIKFWTVLGCREEKLPTVTFGGGFFNFLWAKKI
jgi:hypothetical protein